MYDQLIKKILRTMDRTEPLNPSELRMLAKWKEEYGLKDHIILEAVQRGVNAKKKNVSFVYINGIVSNWHKNNVSNYSDILNLDMKFNKTKNGSSDTYSKIIKVKYHNDKLEKLRYIEGKSDWIDLRSAEDVEMKAGEVRLISLGISVQLPKGYEMIIAPRSSTYKNFGIIQTNSIGVIDESYCGDDDILMMPVKADRDTVIKLNDRICQFRIIKHQPTLEFEEVDHLNTRGRGGFGSTGVK